MDARVQWSPSRILRRTVGVVAAVLAFIATMVVLEIIFILLFVYVFLGPTNTDDTTPFVVVVFSSAVALPFMGAAFLIGNYIYKSVMARMGQ